MLRHPARRGEAVASWLLIVALACASSACREIFPYAATASTREAGAPIDGPTDEGARDRSPPTPEAGVVDLAPAGDGSCPWSDFSTPTRLARVNDAYADDWCPWVSVDGLQLYFKSWRSGGLGKGDLYRATRATLADDFDAPTPVTELNTAGSEDCASLSADGLLIVFGRDELGDLLIANRITPSGRFDAPVILDELRSDAALEASPRLSADGLALLFASTRAGGAGAWDIWVAERRARDDRFSAPQPFPAINGPANELSAELSADGLQVVFASDRAGGAGGLDLWIAQRPALGVPFGAPSPLSGVNTAADDLHARLSADGSTLYFNRETDIHGGSALGGKADIWVAVRSRQCP